MSRLLVLMGGAALLATGFGVGYVASSTAVDPDGTATVPEKVVVRLKDGVTHELTAGEAAARIERLESLVARSGRPRAAAPDEDDGEWTESAPPAALPDVPIPRRPDGKQYTVTELRDLARTSADPVLRRAAIQALRRDDSPAARTILGEITADPKTPLDLRVEAAKGLAKPPHRDAAPDELLALLSSPDLPADVRREVADGVTKLRDRGAWMAEIAVQMGKEADPDVRKLLFDAVQRSAWDPAAKQELLGIASNASASLEERVTAVSALVRQGADKKVIEALKPLLSSADPRLRENAVAALARAGTLGLDQIAAALADDSAAVRIAALAARLPSVGKTTPQDVREQREATLQTAVRLASGDTDPEVRRAALQWTGALDAKTQARVLEAARNDPSPLVQIEGYARSPAQFARAEPERIVTQLDSPDPKVRDAAYRLVVRTWGVDVPYRAGWNPKARAAAVQAIRDAVNAAH